MKDYSKGKIYKIIDNTNGNVYYGSTCEPTLARRLAKHKSNYNSYVNGYPRYITSYKILENGDYSIVLVENCPCNNKDELYARERYYIENNDCVNKNIPGKPKTERNKEYYEKNKDKINEYHKQYYEENKEILIKKNKIYAEENKEERKQYRKKRYEEKKDDILRKHKDYRDTHKEQIKEYKKKYKEENNDKMNAKYAEYRESKRIPINCPCGITYYKLYENGHLKTKTHLKYCEEINKIK